MSWEVPAAGDEHWTEWKKAVDAPRRKCRFPDDGEDERAAYRDDADPEAFRGSLGRENRFDDAPDEAWLPVRKELED